MSSWKGYCKVRHTIILVSDVNNKLTSMQNLCYLTLVDARLCSWLGLPYNGIVLRFMGFCMPHEHFHSVSLWVQLTQVTTRWPLLPMLRLLRELEQPLFWLRTRYGWWKPDFRCVLFPFSLCCAVATFRIAYLCMDVVERLKDVDFVSRFSNKIYEKHTSVACCQLI